MSEARIRPTQRRITCISWTARRSLWIRCWAACWCLAGPSQHHLCALPSPLPAAAVAGTARDPPLFMLQLCGCWLSRCDGEQNMNLFVLRNKPALVYFHWGRRRILTETPPMVSWEQRMNWSFHWLHTSVHPRDRPLMPRPSRSLCAPDARLSLNDSRRLHDH